MNTVIRLFTIVLMFNLFANCSFGQSATKKEITASEATFIEKVFADIAVSDQRYRSLLANGTTDKTVVEAIDSVMNNHGIEAGIAYKASLNLSLEQSIKDSLWELQHQIDLHNHLTLRGLFDTYGFIPEGVVEENNFVQMLLLVHPPKDWDIPTYLATYSALLLQEVKAERMPAKTYATFYDNIKGKILREPQLYGTNQQFNTETKKIMPPGIRSLSESNAARKAIGLPELEEGEYRLLD